MHKEVVRVADFAKLPGARHPDDGDNSADEFFEDNVSGPLRKAIESKGVVLVIDLDGTLGYASSFISQLAVRILEACENKKRCVKKIIEIKSTEDPSQIEEFWNGINKE